MEIIIPKTSSKLKICLVFPKTTIFEFPMVFSPLGLKWIWAVLERAGYDIVHYIDMSDYEEDAEGNRTELFPDITSIPLDCDVYLVSGTSPQARELRKIGRYIKEQGKIGILGGPHSSNYAGPETQIIGSSVFFPGDSNNDLFNDPEIIHNYHICIRFEGEEIILEALKMIDLARKIMDKHGRGIVLVAPTYVDQSKLPIPCRKANHRYRYFLEDSDGTLRRGTTIFTSRGCPKKCGFCDAPFLGGRTARFLPLEMLEQDLIQIKDLGYDAVHAFDDILPIDPRRMEEICKLFKRMGFIWRCFCRVDFMTGKRFGFSFMKMMYDHGCREVLVGVESGSQEILDLMDKDTTVEQNTIVRGWCRDIGIRFKASVILGLPGERMDTMEATRKWVLDNRPDRVNVCIHQMFRGTPISKSAELKRFEGLALADPEEMKRIKQYGANAIREYDVQFDDHAFHDDHYYAGSRDKLEVHVSTSHVTADQIRDFYLEFCADLNRASIPY